MNALLTFLINQLIPAQIQKYHQLASAGVGPDARINARLVKEEVDDLFNIATALLKKEDSSENLALLFNRVRFYVEQEHLRGHAGWLIAENDPHNIVKERTQFHMEQLTEIATQAEIPIQAHTITSASQENCAQYSHVIAFFILDHVYRLKEDPSMAFHTDFPSHAQHILRHNAKDGGRYYQPLIQEQIETLYQQCILFLNPDDTGLNEHERVQKTREQVCMYRAHPAYSPLLKPEATAMATKDRQRLDALKSQSAQSSSLKKFGLFATAIASSALAVCLIRKINTPG